MTLRLLFHADVLVALDGLTSQPDCSLGALCSLSGDFAQWISELVYADITFNLRGQAEWEGQGG